MGVDQIVPSLFRTGMNRQRIFLVNIFRLTIKDIGMIILEKNIGDPTIMEFLEGFDHFFFSRSDDPFNLLDNYVHDTQESLQEMKESFEEIEASYHVLSQFPESQISEFNIERIFVRLYINSHTLNLKAFFDNMKVTENVVMIVLEPFFKVNEFMKEDIKDLIEEEYQPNTIYVILKINSNLIMCRIINETIFFDIDKRDDKERINVIENLRLIFSFEILESDTNSYRGFSQRSCQSSIFSLCRFLDEQQRH